MKILILCPGKIAASLDEIRCFTDVLNYYLPLRLSCITDATTVSIPDSDSEQLKKLLEHGWGNGYVLIPHNHPFYKKHYDSIDVNVHGGLTFSELFGSKQFSKWIKGREIDGDVNLDNYTVKS
jgi:hypothetical protein